jgi:hypothetical protein
LIYAIVKRFCGGGARDRWSLARLRGPPPNFAGNAPKYSSEKVNISGGVADFPPIPVPFPAHSLMSANSLKSGVVHSNIYYYVDMKILSFLCLFFSKYMKFLLFFVGFS